MAETWEDCIALLRAGASPSEVLPKLRELINSAPSGSPEQNLKENNGVSESSPYIFQHQIRGTSLHLPYFHPPPCLWQELSEYPDGPVFDRENCIDLLQEFSPIVVGPPPLEINNALGDLKLMDDPDVSSDDVQSDHDDLGKKARPQIEEVTRMLQDFAWEGKGNLECLTSYFSEAEWSVIVGNLTLDGCLPTTISDLVRVINQPSLSRVVLQSILPILSYEMEKEEFLQLVRTVANSSDLSSIKTEELFNLTSVYRNIESKGALTQLLILCHGDIQ